MGTPIPRRGGFGAMQFGLDIGNQLQGAARFAYGKRLIGMPPCFKQFAPCLGIVGKQQIRFEMLRRLPCKLARGFTAFLLGQLRQPRLRKHGQFRRGMMIPLVV